MPKLAPLTDSRLRKSLKRVNKPQTGWLDVFNAVTGKEDGTLSTGTPGEIWVTNELNGQPLAVHNSISAIYNNIRVEVGRRVDQPNLWQIKNVRETFPVPATAGQVAYHASQHVFRQGDWIPIDRKQLMDFTVMVSDPANFLVAVFGGVATTKNGSVLAETDAGKRYKEIDLTSYIPTTGAKYIDIVLEEDGTLAIVEGTEFEAPAIATVEDIPIPAHNQYIIAYVLLYESMEALSDADIRVIMPLSANYLLNGAEFSGFLAGITSIQDAFEALDEHEHATEPSHVHGLERWNGASGQDTFDLTQIAIEIESLLLNGLEEDPLTYTLSSDGTQISLDTALPSDMTVIAHTVLETT